MLVVRRRAPATSKPSYCSMTLHATFQSDYELRLPQERVGYTMFDGSEGVVGASIASYDLIHASWCCGGPLPRPRPLRTLTPLHDLRAPSKVILSLDCIKSVSRTQCLAALKWWLEQASPPTTT